MSEARKDTSNLVFVRMKKSRVPPLPISGRAGSARNKDRGVDVGLHFQDEIGRGAYISSDVRRYHSESRARKMSVPDAVLSAPKTTCAFPKIS